MIKLQKRYIEMFRDLLMPKDTSQRLKTILELLGHEPRLTVESLVTRLGASPATVRRDLRLLNRQGLLTRYHGGATTRDPALYEQFLPDSNFRSQVHHCTLEKQRIGMAAAELIHDSEKIGVGGGTTVSKALRGLHGRKDLSVVTYAVNVAMELSRFKEIEVHVTGGYLSGNWFALVGPRALDAVRHHFLDKLLFGARGVHPERGVTDYHTEEAAMNGAMVDQARKKILLVDHTKLGVISKCFVCAINQLDIIITDGGASREQVVAFEKAGIEVRCV